MHCACSRINDEMSGHDDFNFHYSFYCRWSNLCHWAIAIRCGETDTCTYTMYIGCYRFCVSMDLGCMNRFIDFAGAGATIPITSFGNALTHGAMAEAEKHGFIGVLDRVCLK